MTTRQYLVAYAPQGEPLRLLGVIHGQRSPRMIAAIVRKRQEAV